MVSFVRKAPSARLFVAPGAFHELLLEAPATREAVLCTIASFFSQSSDDVHLVTAPLPLEAKELDKGPAGLSLPFSWPEAILRAGGVALACVGVVVGVAMMVGGRRADARWALLSFNTAAVAAASKSG
jgi:hypothetical protein